MGACACESDGAWVGVWSGAAGLDRPWLMQSSVSMLPKTPEISGHEPKPQLLHMHADARFVEVLFGELLAWGSAPAATEAETKNLRSSYSKRYAKLFGPLELGWGLLVINLRRTFNQRVSCQGFSWLGF